VKAASAAIRTAIADEGWDRWARARLLPAQVEIALAAGDLATARAAVDELEATVVGYPTPAFEAGCRSALAAVLLAEGDTEGAIREARTGIRRWRDVGAPYEVARSRALLSRVLRAVDDDDSADLELQAAIDELGRLGARHDLEVLEDERRAVAERRSGPQTTRRTFMFTDIVGSTVLAERLGDEAWERLLRWHDEALEALVRRGGGEIVKTTGDGLFAAFAAAAPAVDAAIAIQRALRDHGDATGIALPVRIGLHSAQATQRGSDFSGMGVHVAARIGSLAGGAEILASAETIAEAGNPRATAPRAEAIRGATAPVTVASISWDG
jgi:class 3 adenylate cyclase